MADPKSFELLRPLGHLERFSSSRHHLGFYTNVQLTASYHNANSTIPLQHLVFHTLRQVINQHPVLSAIPLDEDKTTTYFVRLPQIDLRNCVQFIERKTPVPKEAESDEELDSIIEAQHNKNFKDDVGSKPFWRLIVLSSPSSLTEFSASWVFHHALADGTSGAVFHRSFLAALRSITSGAVNSDPMVEPPKTDLIPALETLHKLPLTFAYMAGRQWSDWFPPNQETLWAGADMSYDASTGAITRLKSIYFSASTTKKLVELSRANKTTLTATVQCLVAAAVFFNVDKSKYDTLNAPGPVACRRFLTLDPAQGHIDDAIGSWVTQYDCEHKRGAPGSPASVSGSEESVLDLFSWDEARGVRAGIQLELDKNMKNSIINLFRWIPDFLSFFTGKLGKSRGRSFEISNVGALNRKKDGEGEGEGWKVGRCLFSQCGPVVGSAFGVGVVTGGDGALSLGVSWLDGVVDDELMEKFIDSMEHGFNSLARS